MSNLICPFCQQELRPISVVDHQDERCVWYCPNCATNKRLWVMANERIWQELIRTRKALDVAVDALNTVTATPLNSRVIHDGANKALEQITAE